MIDKPNVLFVIGTRPEAIKIAPIIKEFRVKLKHLYNALLCSTNQSYDILLEVLNDLDLPVDIQVNNKLKKGSLVDFTTQTLVQLDPIIKSYNPVLIIILGDTLSCFSAAFCSYANQVPICHIEAGLRSDNIYSPFPEEGIRNMISKLAKYHFAPNFNAKNNLIKEGIKSSSIYIVGNSLADQISVRNENLSLNTRKQKQYILITQHRRENIPNGIIAILKSLDMLQDKYPNLLYKIIVHPNPKLKRIIHKEASKLDNIELIKPLPHSKFLNLLVNATVVITDSGGVQEETSIMNIPTVVTRNNCERMHLLSTDLSVLSKTEASEIYKNVINLLDKSFQLNGVKDLPTKENNIVSSKIIEILTELLIKI